MIKKNIACALYCSGINSLYSWFCKYNFFCIGYHSIAPLSANPLAWTYPDLTITPDDFEKQVKYLISHNHTFVKFSDVNLPETRKIKKPTVLFFDDGYRDVLTYAVPILQKYALPATIFITTDFIGQTRWHWSMVYRFYLAKQGMTREAIEQKIFELRSKTFQERNIILQTTIAASQVPGPDYENADIFLHWSDILWLHTNGFEIGSHGVTHTRFNECSDDEVEKELSISKSIIESKISSPVATFSFPGGRFTSSALDAVKKAGYTSAVTTQAGFNPKIEDIPNLFTLRKIAPKPGDSLINFAVKLYSGNAFGLT
jgi:peptidoglycan/xylan/chitin deacetylase (PgdA/CDA1 family)